MFLYTDCSGACGSDSRLVWCWFWTRLLSKRVHWNSLELWPNFEWNITKTPLTPPSLSPVGSWLTGGEIATILTPGSRAPCPGYWRPTPGHYYTIWAFGCMPSKRLVFSMLTLPCCRLPWSQILKVKVLCVYLQALPSSNHIWTYLSCGHFPLFRVQKSPLWSFCADPSLAESPVFLLHKRSIFAFYDYPVLPQCHGRL